MSDPSPLIVGPVRLLWTHQTSTSLLHPFPLIMFSLVTSLSPRINPAEAKENVHTVPRQKNITFPAFSSFTHTGRNLPRFRTTGTGHQKLRKNSDDVSVCQCMSMSYITQDVSTVTHWPPPVVFHRQYYRKGHSKLTFRTFIRQVFNRCVIVWGREGVLSCIPHLPSPRETLGGRFQKDIFTLSKKLGKKTRDEGTQDKVQQKN